MPLTHCTGHGQTWFTNGVHPAQMGLTHKKDVLSMEQSGKHWQATSGPKARSRFSKCSPRMFPHLCNTGRFIFCELPTTSGFHISSCPLWFVFSILFLFCFWTSHKFQFSHLLFMFYCFIFKKTFFKTTCNTVSTRRWMQQNEILKISKTFQKNFCF